jgi:hypothetical protein
MFSRKLKTTTLAEIKESIKKLNYYVDKRVIDIIESKYEVLEYIDIHKFIPYPELLDELFANYANFKFAPNQRIILLDHETDYYPSMDSVGFALHNAITLLAYHHIPLENVIFFSNIYGLQREVDTLTRELYNGGTMKVVSTVLWNYYRDDSGYAEINPNNFKIEFLYCCLNRRNRLHRLLTLAYLNYYKLLDKGIITWHSLAERPRLYE